MKDNIREQINIFKNFKLTTEAVKTKCQTEGAIYQTDISDKDINIKVKIPFNLDLDKTEAKLLEDNIHNALELVLTPYFKKR